MLSEKCPNVKALAEKAATKKRPATRGDTPPPKKSKGITAKKKAERPSLPKVEKPTKAEDTRAIVPFVGEDSLMPSTVAKQPDAVVVLESNEKAEEQFT